MTHSWPVYLPIRFSISKHQLSVLWGSSVHSSLHAICRKQKIREEIQKGSDDTYMRDLAGSNGSVLKLLLIFCFLFKLGLWRCLGTQRRVAGAAGASRDVQTRGGQWIEGADMLAIAASYVTFDLGRGCRETSACSAVSKISYGSGLLLSLS